MIGDRAWYKSWFVDLPKELEVKEKPLYALIADSAKKFPSKDCLRYQGRNLSYAEVDELSSRFASALLKLGLGKGDRVGIFMPNIPQFVIAYFGILKAGGIVVTCSPLYKARELEHQLTDAGVSIMVAARDVVKENDLYRSLEECRGQLALSRVIATSITDYLPGIKKSLAGLAGVKNVRRKETEDFVELLRLSQPIEKPADVDPVNDVALLQYTGGTTGTSKGAMLTHWNLFSNAVVLAQMLPVTEKDVCLAVLPLFHIYGMTTAMNMPLYAGARIVLLPSFHVEEVMKTIQTEKVTAYCGVPTMYVAINNHPSVSKFDLRSISACVSGGAALPVAVRKKFIDITGGNLVEGYGLTEASPVTHVNPLHGGVVKDGSIGIPISSTDAKIVSLDDYSRELPQGEVGELAVKGPQVMKGYWNKDEETKGVLKNGWLLTGDIAKMDQDGYFFIVDRRKDMVDVGGLKVYPREVEEVLFEHPAVREAAVIGIPDKYMGEVPKAFVVLKDPQHEIPKEQLVEYCSQRLAKYKVPRNIEFVSDLPKTLVGKVLRRKLKESATSPQS